MTKITDRHYTVVQLAKQLGCHPETIKRAIRRGELGASRDPLAPGRPLLISEAEKRAFIARRSTV